MKANIDSVNVYLENETKLLSEWLISDDEDFINDTFSLIFSIIYSKLIF